MKFSTFVNQETCLGDAVYQDPIALHTQLFYKELPKFYYLALIRNVNYV
jgi:hypothetical protein